MFLRKTLLLFIILVLKMGSCVFCIMPSYLENIKSFYVVTDVILHIHVQNGKLQWWSYYHRLYEIPIRFQNDNTILCGPCIGCESTSKTNVHTILYGVLIVKVHQKLKPNKSFVCYLVHCIASNFVSIWIGWST